MSVEFGSGSAEGWRKPGPPAGIGPDTLAYLYDTYAGHLFDYCAGILRDQAAAAEAVQAALIAAAAQIGKRPDPDRLSGWLYSIARRQCLRDLASRCEEPIPDGCAGEQAGPADAGDAHIVGADPGGPVTQTLSLGSASARTAPIGAADAETAGPSATGADTTGPVTARGATTGADITGPVTARGATTGADTTRADPAGADPAGLAVADLEAEVRRTETLLVVTAALDGLSDRDREVLSLAFRHGIDGADLADILGVSTSRAQVLVSSAASRFERAAGAVAVVRAGWQGCPVPAAIVGDWRPVSAPLAPEVWTRLIRHVDSCASCAQDSRRQVFSRDQIGAVPLALPPAALRARVMSTALAAEAGSYPQAGDQLGSPDDHGLLARHWRGPGGLALRPIAACTAALMVLVVAGALLYKFTAAPTAAPGPAAAAAPKPGAHRHAPVSPPASPAAATPRFPRTHQGGPTLAMFPGAARPSPSPLAAVPQPTPSGRAPSPLPASPSQSPHPPSQQSSPGRSPSPSPSPSPPPPSSSTSPTAPASPTPTSPSPSASVPGSS
ncbi:MAG TPA: sigma-70 family RNA polymerase sigma factor [Streptosporangiaceae bacterium]|nr:sigma-70 family RNA polymerase sigma factor [Streptosporangiaceae bacterium]